MTGGEAKPEQVGLGIPEVIARAKGGDSQAWTQLYTQFAPMVYRFCRRAMPSREDAEDATSEVFLKVQAKLDQYDASRPFQAWLYRVAANHCWDLLRRRRVRQDLEVGDIESMPLEHPDPGQLERMVAEHSHEEVRHALATLPSRTRMALTLRYYAEMSYDEVAEELGVRRAFVGVLLLRARHELRRALEEMRQGVRAKVAGNRT